MARILLAEDDEGMRRVLAKALRAAGHELGEVGDGLAAEALLEDGKWDLLLADVVMPGLDGIELARRASRRCPGLKVMFITGFAAVAMDALGRDPLQARLVSKPFHLRDLVGEVESILQSP